MLTIRSVSVFLLAAVALGGQESVRMTETLPVGTQYLVSCQVDINGSLTLPLEKGEMTPRTLPVSGGSRIDYGERVLTVNKLNQVKTTLRMYNRLEFNRKVGTEQQSGTVRPAVRRMVILRQNQIEVPFSPDGPMTWNELDLIRTDVFTPALAGLLPSGAVQVNQTWSAAAFSVQELTDLDQIEEGTLTCRMDQIGQIDGRRQAKASFLGDVRGVGEDGPTRHHLEGYFYFDLDANLISYLSMHGTRQLLDKSGKTVGKIEGSFTLTRRRENTKELADQALQGLKLEPNEDNTLLLCDNTELGVRFVYPRRWRIAGVRGQQIALDENGGSGLLLTVDDLKNIPTAAQFLNESRAWLEKEKAKILRTDPPRQIQAAPKSVEAFSIDVEIGGQRALMDYLVVRQARSGATVAARIVSKQQALIVQDVEKIVRGIQLR
jgi:hypothetical protein